MKQLGVVVQRLRNAGAALNDVVLLLQWFSESMAKLPKLSIEGEQSEPERKREEAIDEPD